MTKTSHISLVYYLSLTLLLTYSGCAAPAPKQSPQRHATTTAGLADPNAPALVATVNGYPIEKQTLVDLLLRGHGARILDELILTEVVRRHARQEKISLTEKLIDNELDRLLDDMAPDRPRAEQLSLLKYMLRRRQLTRPQFDLIIERQALLRRMVDKKVDITDEMIADEYQRRHGARVQVRQLVVATLRQIEIAEERLARGENFVNVVRDMSEDQRSAANDGLLPPFSRADENVPLALRLEAFQLTQVNPVSGVIQYRDDQSRDHWALMKLERSIPPDGTPLDEAHNELTTRLQQQIIGKRMFDLQESLRSAADINILDPQLQSVP